MNKQNKNYSIGIVGLGAWGSALFSAFASQSCYAVIGYERNIKTQPVSNQVVITDQMSKFAQYNFDLLIFAVPVNAFSSVLQDFLQHYFDFILKNYFTKPSDLLPRQFAIAWVCKGFEENSAYLPSKVYLTSLEKFQNTFKQQLNIDYQQTGNQFSTLNTHIEKLNAHIEKFKNNYLAILGPSFAKEVKQQLYTSLVVASNNHNLASDCAKILNNIPFFKIFINLDIIGCEIGAAIKNVIAIITGLSDGLSLGSNTRAALITQGLQEIAKIIIAYGGKQNTINSLSVVGDLMLTCATDLSRNRRVGLELALGKSLSDIIIDMKEVAEGVKTTKIVYEIITKLHINAPLILTIYNILYLNHNPCSSIKEYLASKNITDEEFMECI